MTLRYCSKCIKLIVCVLLSVWVVLILSVHGVAVLEKPSNSEIIDNPTANSENVKSVTAADVTDASYRIEHYSKWLELVNDTTNILVNIVVFVGGIMGLNYINKLKERQKDATFNYLTKLNVRLKYFNTVVERYDNELQDRLLPQNKRRGVSSERVREINDVFKALSENATETLQFLKSETEQFPAQKGWSKKLNSFIDFLILCEKLTQESFFDVTSISMKVYCSNIGELIEMVTRRQNEIEDELFSEE